MSATTGHTGKVAGGVRQIYTGNGKVFVDVLDEKGRKVVRYRNVVCKACGLPFLSLNKRGRPRLYCPFHRGKR